ncbi:hypothetical protein [Bradyrhizobium sp.]|uniref:hypothetical protein n=1 Tax=Bradyrhizobium sp. TaxID=376 RepID=UPI002D6B5A8C|nr:hypothetical protein [Bradyrhizobium sp.]HZR74548.1 hypothetical protein [Bradyrhizobium sp.]
MNTGPAQGISNDDFDRACARTDEVVTIFAAASQEYRAAHAMLFCKKVLLGLDPVERAVVFQRLRETTMN